MGGEEVTKTGDKHHQEIGISVYKGINEMNVA